MKNGVPKLALALLLTGAASWPAFAVEDSAQFTTEVPSDAIPISTYYEEDVYDNQNNEIGEVEDVLLDKDGRVSAVIIGVGGFLDVGEKNVAVSFNALKLTKEEDGDKYLVMNTTKEALESAPGYTYDQTKDVWIPEAKKPS
jgi:sporulation protein YlmC with PRC-barrel domain